MTRERQQNYNEAMQNRIDTLFEICATGDIETNAGAFEELAQYMTAYEFEGRLRMRERKQSQNNNQA